MNKYHFYTAWADKPIIIYSDSSGLRDFQLGDISDIDNEMMFNIKAYIKSYKYTIKHWKEVKILQQNVCLEGQLGF